MELKFTIPFNQFLCLVLRFYTEPALNDRKGQNIVNKTVKLLGEKINF